MWQKAEQFVRETAQPIQLDPTQSDSIRLALNWDRWGKNMAYKIMIIRPSSVGGNSSAGTTTDVQNELKQRSRPNPENTVFSLEYGHFDPSRGRV